MNFRHALNRFWRSMITIQGEPRRIAAGFALGLFVGMAPAMGVQMVIAIGAAMACRVNKIAAAGAVWITNPITAPFVYPFTYFVGDKFLHISDPDYLPRRLVVDWTDWESVQQVAGEVVWALLVGGIIVGIPLAVIGYFLCYNGIVRYRQTREKLRQRVAQ